ncbi:LexA family protein [Aestuariirhabdus litorea]|uniref:DNA polymerase V n=1 Tax=Aestuariirhabdus litorea TaxID=2528527 RepID=A0A3P3VMT9_9GAMM|nr:translesion error-prone DNA polymerase V autoproteolytic subunit [Aestuariirhabdus litorea]RRJ84005.1 DNA polymerase V [Aestuariirhabdus litorea]RWW97225.1 translesion error-prone DNA polymerase V autoproteolytic subunit [Endozoicomonadaceae bacterium GTF-13]
MKIAITKACTAPSTLSLPLLSHGVAAGFPSPADDYIDRPLDLNEHLIKHPAATYFARANGDSLNGRGIFDRDLLVVDRSLRPLHGDLVVAAIDGELCCKILDLRQRQLCSANPAYPPVALPEEADLVIEGVVIHAIHHLRAP